MTHTLLIWEMIPEETRLYLIPDEVAEKYTKYLKEAHNHLINRDKMNDGLRFLNTALGTEDPEKGFEDSVGVFAAYKVDKQYALTDQHITAVYHSGFIL